MGELEKRLILRGVYVEDGEEVNTIIPSTPATTQQRRAEDRSFQLKGGRGGKRSWEGVDSVCDCGY